MIRTFFSLSILLLFSGLTYAQNSFGADCIYRTIEDFVENVCDNDRPYIDKVVGKRDPVKKYQIKTKRNNKRLKEAFAVVIDGELYYQIYEIHRYMAKKDRLPSARNADNFIKVKSSGVYDYLEYSEAGGGGPGVGIGSGGFGTGIGLGTSLNLGKKKVTGLIYDPVNFEFNVFENCKDFNQFLAERHPQFSYECKKKKLDIEQVRKVIGQINGKAQKVSLNAEVSSGKAKNITIYPHRTIVRNACTLLVGDKEIDFDDLTVLELTIDCEATKSLCVKDTEACLDIICDDGISHYIISKDREANVYLIENSNPDDFKYYNALLERRRNRGK